MFYFLAALAGALTAYMTYLNGSLSGTLGNFLALVIIHGVGLLGLCLLLLIKRHPIRFERKIPLYFYTGGMIGVFTVLFSALSYNHIGVAVTSALGLFGQSLLSLIIDSLGLVGMKKTPFNAKKSIGLLLILAGILVMVFV